MGTCLATSFFAQAGRAGRVRLAALGTADLDDFSAHVARPGSLPRGGLPRCTGAGRTGRYAEQGITLRALSGLSSQFFWHLKDLVAILTGDNNRHGRKWSCLLVPRMGQAMESFSQGLPGHPVRFRLAAGSDPENEKGRP